MTDDNFITYFQQILEDQKPKSFELKNYDVKFILLFFILEISSFDFDRWSEMTHASNCSVSC